MKLIKVGAGVLNQTPLDWDGNRDRIIAAIHAAQRQQISVLCLPELCITGYGCEDAFHAVGVQETAQQILLEILPETKGIAVSLGLPMFHRGGLFNAACLALDGEILGFVGKQNLAGEGLHYEPRWFKAWPADSVVETQLGSQSYPLGDLIFECGDLRLGFEICEDAWVADRPGSHLSAHGVVLERGCRIQDRRDVDLAMVETGHCRLPDLFVHVGHDDVECHLVGGGQRRRQPRHVIAGQHRFF